jgi:hypothetical protein
MNKIKLRKTLAHVRIFYFTEIWNVNLITEVVVERKHNCGKKRKRRSPRGTTSRPTWCSGRERPENQVAQITEIAFLNSEMVPSKRRRCSWAPEVRELMNCFAN